MQEDGKQVVRKQRRGHGIALAATGVCLLLAVLAGGALAEEGGEGASSSETDLLVPQNSQHEPGETLGAAEPIAFLGETNAGAAEILPNRDLGRSEAAHLLQAVFEEPLDSPAGIFEDLQVEHFHTDHVAVVDGPNAHNGLLQSVLPLRTVDDHGTETAVDLDLVAAGGGELEADNPLVEVAIPSELGEGIALPESAIELKLAGAPAERAPSLIDGGGAAFFPNVAQDSDLTVVATPTGIETFAHLRSPDAPLSQTYELTMPAGAILEERPNGGAEITRDGAILAHVPPPTAIDAEGDSVPVSLAVVGDSLTVTSAPQPDSAYPILVDPVVETYYWALNNHTDGIGDWTAASSHSLFEARSYGYGGAEKGLNIYSYGGGSIPAGTQANWNYHVPRYYSDQATYGTRPSSFITKMSLTGMYFWIESGSAPYPDSPFIVAGLWDELNNWFASKAVHTGSQGSISGGWTNLENPNENIGVKEGGIALHTGSDTQSRPRHLWVGQASVEISDKDYPSFASAQGPKQWINGLSTDNTNLKEAIEFQASDLGLGVYALLAKAPKLGGGTNQWEQTPGCPGNARTPCPRVWKGGFWNYNPKVMPQGENVVELIGKDPVWHFSDQASPSLAVKAKVKVDRTQPTLALSGSLTEQGTLGTWLPSYALKIDTTDGVEGAPQSGVTKVQVLVDGVLSYESSPGCSTRNCAVNREWTMDVDDFAPGLKRIEVVAYDAVGLQKASAFYVTIHGDQTNPTLALSGSMTEQGSLGTTRPSYMLKLSATDSGSAEERKSGVASTTIKVDGKTVDLTSPGCPAGGCSINREWTLDSNSYSVGAHTVEVKATDDAGRSTTKSLTVNIARDNTPPQIQATTPFYEAPEGWVEHKTYNNNATATDTNGYGVTSLSLKIDGNVIKTASGACPTGGCTRMLGLFSTIDLSGFDGGAHPAELVASDGAGNVAKRSWTINVDPAGTISVGEATDTLEAVEETAPETTQITPVDGLVTTVVGEGGVNPQLASDEGHLVSTGAPAPSTIELDPHSGFAVETSALDKGENLQAESIEVVPLQVGVNATEPQITDGSAAVISNSAGQVDTILRPSYDGLMAFQSIRDMAGPETYSWEVNLGEGEYLELIDANHAAIFWEDGTQALLIAAQQAHGADGKAVQTSLSVSEGNVVTLTVNHRAPNVVYPVVAGVGWQGGFQTHAATIEVPEPEIVDPWCCEISEEFYSSPPEVFPTETSDPGGYVPLSGSNDGYDPDKKYMRKFGARRCAQDFKVEGYGCGLWKQTLKGFFWFKYRQKVWWSREPACPGDSSLVYTVNAPSVCAWVGPSWQKYGGGHHITAQVLFSVTFIKFADTREKALSVYAYGSGYWNEHKTDCVCNPLPTD